MRWLISIIILLFSLTAFGQVKPKDFPEKTTATGSDHIYSQGDGSDKKILFSTAKKYFTPAINTTPIAYVPTPTGNGSNLMEFVKTAGDSIYYIDAGGKAFLLFDPAAAGASAWGDLSGIPAGFADGVDNVNDADDSATNELAEFTAAPGAPGSPNQGDLWWKNTTDSVFVYDGGNWAFLAIRAGGTGISGLTDNYLTRANGSSSIENSIVYDNGTGIGVGSSSFPTAGTKLHIPSVLSVYTDGFSGQTNYFFGDLAGWDANNLNNGDYSAANNFHGWWNTTSPIRFEMENNRGPMQAYFEGKDESWVGWQDTSAHKASMGYKSLLANNKIFMDFGFGLLFPEFSWSDAGDFYAVKSLSAGDGSNLYPLSILRGHAGLTARLYNTDTLSGRGMLIRASTKTQNRDIFSVATHDQLHTALHVNSGGTVTINAPQSTPTPENSAALDVRGTSKGVLFPRLTTVQKNAISSPATGLQVYDTDLKGRAWFNGTQWLSDYYSFKSDFPNKTFRRSQVSVSPNGATIVLESSNGTEASPLTLGNSSGTGTLRFRGYDGTAYRDAGEVRGYISGSVSTDDFIGNVGLFTRPSGASPTLLEVITATGGGAVGIGSVAPHASAKLDVASTTRGFLPPRMTTAQKNAISSPAVGLQVYDATAGFPYWFDGTAWRQVLSKTLADATYLTASDLLCTDSIWTNIDTIFHRSYDCTVDTSFVEITSTNIADIYGTTASFTITSPTDTIRDMSGAITSNIPGTFQMIGETVFVTVPFYVSCTTGRTQTLFSVAPPAGVLASDFTLKHNDAHSLGGNVIQSQVGTENFSTNFVDGKILDVYANTANDTIDAAAWYGEVTGSPAYPDNRFKVTLSFSYIIK